MTGTGPIRSSSPLSNCATATLGRENLEEDLVQFRLGAASVGVVALQFDVLIGLVADEFEAPAVTVGLRAKGVSATGPAHILEECCGMMPMPAKSPIVESQVASGVFSVILTV